jgi:hypothetical protein
MVQNWRAIRATGIRLLFLFCHFFVPKKKERLELIKMVRNLMTTSSKGNTRLYFESSILETANFLPGMSVDLRVEREAIFLVRSEEGDGVISRRQRAG